MAYMALPLTLKGVVRGWFWSLAPKSVGRCGELARMFLTQFMTSRRRRRPTTYLLTIKQREDESLKAYLAIFNKERMTTDDKDETITLAADGFINAEDMLWALTKPKKTELEQKDRKAKASGKAKAPEKIKRGHQDRRRDEVP
ncbi:uncharacterized protein LOC122304732 [Carya illinoinensis]|uniref:uncharacterized protein LOC122304732 n=1 Tax=Carya illinoinensis TaxID=32201 RepID=UPI001C728754|nr:uncharacterized protein LOC122304732 [Carya illinoinensis]